MQPESHRHKCPACGYVWEHPDYVAGMPGLHNCMVCGTLVLSRHKDFVMEIPKATEPDRTRLVWILLDALRSVLAGVGIASIVRYFWN